jgi:hypothetical protein
VFIPFLEEERTPTLGKKERGWEGGGRATRCHPPRPTAFFTTPVRPTNVLFVRLFPVTRTCGHGGEKETTSQRARRRTNGVESRAHAGDRAKGPMLFLRSRVFFEVVERARTDLRVLRKKRELGLVEG